MKVFVLLVLIFCAQSSNQQLNRQQHQIQSLTYSEADYNPLPISRTTTATTTTEEPETTTKKKGFFSGFTGLFKSKDKAATTQEPATTQKSSVSVTTTTVKSTTVVSTSTVKSAATNVAPTVSVSTPKVPPRNESPVSTPKLPPRPESLTPPSTPKLAQRPDSQIVSTTPKIPPRSEYPALPAQPVLQQTSTAAPKKTVKDDFPPLPTQPNRQQPTVAPSLPNAWGKPPGIASGTAPKPQSFFSQIPSDATTRKPQIASQASTVSSGPVTDAELLTLSESLFSKDIYNAFKFVTVNYQGRTQSSAKTDEASQPLLKIDEKLFSQSTVEKMKLMYNNYEQDSAINEYVSPNEKKEEDDFIDAVLATPVMRHAMNFLTQKGIVTADPQTHRDLLKTIWFNLYSRGMGKIGSSGFEHVFLSEVKNGTVMGLHNWIYMSEAETSGDLDYKGWTKKIDLGNKGQIAKVRFTLNKLEKPSNSLFIGTSPELELALYTVCFELRADKECRLAYGGKDFNIVTHSYRYRGKNLIGSAYPEI